MNLFSKTIIPLFLAAGLLASCSSYRTEPALNEAEIMETAISTVSTAAAETQGAIATNTPMALPTVSLPTVTPAFQALPTLSFPTTPSTPLPLPASPTPWPTIPTYTPLAFTDPSIPLSERIVYYYFLRPKEWKQAYNGCLMKVLAFYKGLICSLLLLYGCGPSPASAPLAALSEGCTIPGTVIPAELPQPSRGYPYSCRVYLPPCYPSGAASRYPVLYLVPGRTSAPDTWFAAGLAEVVDEMILAGEIQPFIIVTTENIEADPSAETIYRELIPYIEEQYPILDDRRYRAVRWAGSPPIGWHFNIPKLSPVQASSVPERFPVKRRASLNGCRRWRRRTASGCSWTLGTRISLCSTAPK